MVLHINRKSSKQKVLQGLASVSGLDRAQLIAGGSSPSDLCWMEAKWRDLEGSRKVGGSLRWQIPTLTLVWTRAHRLSVFLVSYERSQFATRVGRRSNQILVRSRFTKICGTLGRLGFLIFIRFR
jgi:hypothetical protein